MVYYAMILPFEVQEVEGVIDHAYVEYVEKLKETGEKYITTLDKKLPDYVYPESFRNTLPMHIWSTT